MGLLYIIFRKMSRNYGRLSKLREGWYNVGIGVVAHLVERSIRIAEVGSSSLPYSTTKLRLSLCGSLFFVVQKTRRRRWRQFRGKPSGDTTFSKKKLLEREAYHNAFLIGGEEFGPVDFEFGGGVEDEADGEVGEGGVQNVFEVVF